STFQSSTRTTRAGPEPKMPVRVRLGPITGRWSLLTTVRSTSVKLAPVSRMNRKEPLEPKETRTVSSTAPLERMTDMLTTLATCPGRHPTFGVGLGLGAAVTEGLGDPAAAGLA